MDVHGAHRIEKLNYALGAVLTLIALLTFGQEAALGVLVGALLSSINFGLIRRLVERVLEGTRTGKGAAGAAALFFPKMLGLLGAVALAVFLLPISPITLAIGFSVFLVSIAVETIRNLFSGANGGPAGAGGADPNGNETA